MNIPDKVINAVEMLHPADRGQVYCAIIRYMHDGAEPDFEMSGTAKGIFLLAKMMLDPVLRRRRRDAAYRRRKKDMAKALDTEADTAMPRTESCMKAQPIMIEQLPSNPYDSIMPLPADDACPTFRSRREKRAYERNLKKEMAKIKAPRSVRPCALTI